MTEAVTHVESITPPSASESQNITQRVLRRVGGCLLRLSAAIAVKLL